MAIEANRHHRRRYSHPRRTADIAAISDRQPHKPRSTRESGDNGNLADGDSPFRNLASFALIRRLRVEVITSRSGISICIGDSIGDSIGEGPRGERVRSPTESSAATSLWRAVSVLQTKPKGHTRNRLIRGNCCLGPCQWVPTKTEPRPNLVIRRVSVPLLSQALSQISATGGSTSSRRPKCLFSLMRPAGLEPATRRL